MALAMITVIGCKKESARTFDHSAAEDLAGTFAGTWSQVDTAGTVLSSGEGTVVFETVMDAEGKLLPYAAKMTVTCSAMALDASVMVNVAHKEDEIVFYQNDAKGLMPDPTDKDATVPTFVGTVKKDGSTTFNYQLKTGKGKKAKKVINKFVGAK